MKFFFFISVLFLCAGKLVAAQCRERQKSSLVSLFTPPPNLSWASTVDCCSWSGVTCDNSTGEVVALDLTNCSIKGLVNSPALTALRSLQILNLSLNHFNSSIPSGISQLWNLIHLNLSYSWFYGEVPAEISRLKSLRTLDLSTSSLQEFTSLQLASPNFEYLVGNLSDLRELYLDGVVLSSSWPALQSLVGLVNLRVLHLRSCNLTGYFPAEIFHMPNLEILDVSNNPFLSGTLPNFPENGSLHIFILSNSNFSGVLPRSIGNLRLLEKLQLRSCNFSGEIPSSVIGIPGLIQLDISSNSFSGEIPALGSLTQLVYLDISLNNFSGLVPSLVNLTQLNFLDLSSNRFSGRIPTVDSLKSLIEVSFSNNNFSGAIGSTFGNGLLKLTTLDLRNNSLQGAISSTLFSLPSVKSLFLSHNKFESRLEFQSASPSLITLDLSNNKLQGPVPPSIFRFAGLNVLSLASNNFSGDFHLNWLQNLTNLSSLDLSDNLLSVIAGSNGGNSYPQMSSLKLRSCNLITFPKFLKIQSRLSILDLSNNAITGEIYNWVWEIGNLSLNYLNLSYNRLRGLEQPPLDFTFSSLTVIDLHHNMLEGSIPLLPPSATIVDFSHNNFTSVSPAENSSFALLIFFSLASNKISGKIPSRICNAIFLRVLDLSNNSMHGPIPTCLDKLSWKLQVLNLGKNHFTGIVPRNFVDGCSLRTLNLNGNCLKGPLPTSLMNCTQLEVLNLGNNLIEDRFPSWLGSLLELRVLILRHNKLYGSVEPQEDEAFQNLQIVDLSSNNFSGNLSSRFFEKLKGMMADEGEGQSKRHHQILKFEFLLINPFYYQETITITLKGIEMELSKILTIFASVDISKNRFQGDIPETIGNLRSLYMLNLSGNHFTGPIPSLFANLRQLESLDLSVNQLSGEIPKELTILTFLSFLNVSDNNFVGQIPQDSQFSTFSIDSFKNNSGLCGPPLTKQCEKTNDSRSVDLQQRNAFNWSTICMGLGFGSGVGMIFAPLAFLKKMRRWFNKHVDELFSMVVPECVWPIVDCYSGKIEAEEKVENKLLDFRLDVKTGEERQCCQNFCVFCTQIGVDWGSIVHRECTCLDSSPLHVSPKSQFFLKRMFIS